jgi:histone deacetylase 6
MTEIGNSEEMITEQLEVPVDVQMESSVDSAPEPEQVESSAEDRENLKRKRDSTLALELGEDDEDESTDDTYEEEETASESAATEEMDSAATEQNDGEVQEGVPKLAGMPENVQLEEILNNSISDAASVSGLVYDARLLAHAPLKKEDFDHPENPERIRKIYEALKDSGCLYKFKRIQVKQAREDQIVQFHSKEHFMEMMATSEFDTETLILKAQEFNSIYLNAQSSYCALLSCGGVISLVDAVWNGEVKNGFAIVRPPGHHAEPEEPMGFCLFNNVAIAALHLKKEYKAKRIAIIDWDVHHGNGTQTAFYEDKEVLFISLHRYDNGKFYPSFKNADYTYVGNGDAVGMNINIPWPSGGFGDQDYIYAFQKVILPVLAEFEPEIILVSCGFDAALNDPIGACSVTPQGYEHMTYMLGQFANGKLVLALEGGYHLESVARSAVSCARVLLGNSPRELPKNENGISLECVKIVDKVISTLSPFWRCFGRYHISPDMLRNSFIPDRASKEDLQLHSTINSMSLVPVKGITISILKRS